MRLLTLARLLDSSNIMNCFLRTNKACMQVWGPASCQQTGPHLLLHLSQLLAVLVLAEYLIKALCCCHIWPACTPSKP